MHSPSMRQIVLVARLLTEVDVNRSVRRSGLGPLWTPLGLCLAVALLGTLFGTMMKSNLTGYRDYFSSLATGMIAWHFLASVANESCMTIIRWLPQLRHTPLPLAALPISVLMRLTPLFLINVGLFLVAQILFLETTPSIPALILTIILLILNAAWISPFLIILTARFRDVGQLTNSLTQIGFFLTPILWTEIFIGRYTYFLDSNPLFYPVAALRRAALGQEVAPYIWIVLLLTVLLGIMLVRICQRRAQVHLPYWI